MHEELKKGGWNVWKDRGEGHTHIYTLVITYLMQLCRSSASKLNYVAWNLMSIQIQRQAIGHILCTIFTLKYTFLNPEPVALFSFFFLLQLVTKILNAEADDLSFNH